MAGKELRPSGRSQSLFCACWKPRNRNSDGLIVGETLKKVGGWPDEVASDSNNEVADGQIEATVNDGQIEATVNDELIEATVNDGLIEATVHDGQVEATVNDGQIEISFDEEEEKLLDEEKIASDSEHVSEDTLAEEDEVVTPKKMGGVYVYDTPDGAPQDYDVPPTQYPSPASSSTVHGQPAPSGGESGTETYDNPPMLRPHGDGQEDPVAGLYDAPRAKMMGDDTYDVPRAHLVIKGLDPPPSGSNRSSTVSMLSTGSSGLSVRSSLDTSGHDIYDYPPAPKIVTSTHGYTMQNSKTSDGFDIYDTPPKARMLGDNEGGSTKELSKDTSFSEIGSLCQKEPSYQEISDIPMKLEKGNMSLSSQFDAGDYIDDYAVPRSDTSRSSGDSGIDTSKMDPAFDLPSSSNASRAPSDIYDVPPGQVIPAKEFSSKPDTVSSQLKETEADIAFQRLQVSDTGAVYDVPPQVTKDSPGPLPPKHGAGGSATRPLWDPDSPDLQPYEPLRLEVEGALEILARLQQEVHAAAYRLLSFVGKNWRKHENLHPKLYSVKQACMSIKRSLQEYLEFGQGVVANASNGMAPEKRDLAKEINQLLDPLMDSHSKIKVCLKNLDALQWQTEKLAHKEDEAGDSLDDLDRMVTLAKGIPLTARTLTLLIQGNAKTLFRTKATSPGTDIPGHSPANPLSASKSPILPGRSSNIGTASPLLSQLNKKPSVADKAAKPPPPPLRPKPKTTSAERSGSMKDRPLPTPPGENTMSASGCVEAVEAMAKEPLYNTPKPAEGVYNEIPEKPYPEHYDYVHLTKDSEKGSKESVKSEDAGSVLSVKMEEEESAKKSSDSDTLELPKGKAGGLSLKFKARLERLQKDSEKPVQMHTESSTYDNPSLATGKSLTRSQLHENDALILDFYASQVDTHIEVLLNAIDAFMKCVDYNQPPKVFIAHSKFVILAAHKLVYIGDTITRNLLSEQIRNQLMVKGNHLCDCLKATVVGTKNAALNYPSVSVTQEMVDRVVEVSLAANELRQLISSASASGD